jgi:hypothetical protein
MSLEQTEPVIEPEIEHIPKIKDIQICCSNEELFVSLEPLLNYQSILEKHRSEQEDTSKDEQEDTSKDEQEETENVVYPHIQTNLPIIPSKLRDLELSPEKYTILSHTIETSRNEDGTLRKEIPVNIKLNTRYTIVNTLKEDISTPTNQLQSYTEWVISREVSKLVETGCCPSFPLFFGAFEAKAQEYQLLITDEFPAIRHEYWFIEKNGHTFRLKMDLDEELSVNSGKQLEPLTFNAGNAGLEEFGIEVIEDPEPQTSQELQEPQENEYEEIRDIDDDYEILHSSEDFEKRDVENDEHRTNDCESFSEVESLNGSVSAILKETPVIGYINELLEGPIGHEIEDGDFIIEKKTHTRWASMLFQICFALSIAQKTLGFTHNDLHIDNIMWQDVPETYNLWYRVGKTLYKVPSFGRIMKIIDFGRGIIHNPSLNSHSHSDFVSHSASSEKEWLVSEAFHPDNDAGGQYNIPPFEIPELPRREPNNSFDLARLGCSILESLYHTSDSLPKNALGVSRSSGELITKFISGGFGGIYKTTDPIFNLLIEWTTDSEGYHILWSGEVDEEGTLEDRYGPWELYCKIAQTSSRGVPKYQLEKQIFKQFVCKSGTKPPEGKLVYSFEP